MNIVIQRASGQLSKCFQFFLMIKKIYLIASSSSISILMPHRQKGKNEKQWIEILS